MCAWGYNSFENDTACDFKDNLINIKPIEKLAKLPYHSNQCSEVRATCEFLCHLSKMSTKLWADQEIIDLLKLKLDFISKDQKWLDLWNDKKAIEKSLSSLKRRFSKVVGY